jgi:hypothetical protein
MQVRWRWVMWLAHSASKSAARRAAQRRRAVSLPTLRATQPRLKQTGKGKWRPDVSNSPANTGKLDRGDDARAALALLKQAGPCDG